MKWGVIFTIVLFLLPGMVLGACNITDDTAITSDTTLSANETPCYVTDANGDGAIIINASDVSLDCGWAQIVGNGTGYGIVSGKDRTNVKNCNVSGYSSDVWFSGNSSTLLNSVLGGLKLTGGHAWIQNNTMSGLSLAIGYNENNTIIENTINGAVSVASQHAGDAPWFRLINNTITMTSHLASAIGVATIKPLAYAEITGNKINATASGDSYCIYLYGHNNRIENNELHCRYVGIKFHGPSDNNVVRNNVFGGTDTGKTYVAMEISNSDGNNISSNNFTDVNLAMKLQYGSSGNLFWDNYFYVIGSGIDASNIFNITKTLATNIIGGSWLGGNWWWDYVGEDLDGDGIGDTNLPHHNDYLPLVLPPYTYENCNQTFGTLTVEAGRTYNFTNCNVTFGTVTVKEYGKLYIEDSNVYAQSSSWSLSSEGKTIIRVRNSEMNDCSLNMRSDITELTGSTFTNCAVGIIGSDATITGNTMDGLSINSSQSAKILNNRLTTIYLGSTSNADIAGNELDGLIIEGGLYNSAHDMTLKSLKFQTNESTAWNLTFGTAAPEVYGGRNELRDITANAGFKLSGADNVVKGSRITGDFYFPWGYQNNNTLRDSTIINGTIYSQSQTNPAPSVKIIGNAINFTGATGIDLAFFTSGTRGSVVADNKIYSVNKAGDDECVHIEGNENSISGNSFDCSRGLKLGGSIATMRNNVTRNRFVGGKIGLLFKSNDTVDNVIWDNYFDNAEDVVFQCNATHLQLNNQWNVTKAGGTNILGGKFIAGNYWHDYSGYDIDSDGIGDTEVPKWRDWLPLTLRGPPANDTERKKYNEDDFRSGNTSANETKKEENKSGCGKDKIPICHATSSETNPYNFLCVSENAADGNGKNDHSHHAGDVIPVTDTNGDGAINQDDCPTTFYYEEKKEACKGGCKKGETEEINAEKTSVVQILITPAKDLQDMKIHIKHLPERPSETDELHGTVYQYMQIDNSATDEEIAEASIRFAIDNGWLATNNYDPGKITLKRWHDGYWASLPTKKESSDGEKTYYIATTPGFSYFAIALETEETATDSPTGYFIMPATGTLASAAIAACALVFYVTRGKPKKKTKKKAKKARKRAR
ncbi:MAG: NosD domain-containing protein [Candidatus Aenigmatarchaeota archaeon]